MWKISSITGGVKGIVAGKERVREGQRDMTEADRRGCRRKRKDVEGSLEQEKERESRVMEVGREGYLYGQPTDITCQNFTSFQVSEHPRAVKLMCHQELRPQRMGGVQGQVRD